MSNPTVLIAEDNRGLARVLSCKLRTTGMLPTVCRDGAEAWAAFESQRPTAIISDYQLPGLNGLEFAKRVRQVASAEELPFVLVTGRESELDAIELRVSLGISAVLAKPFSPTELCELLRDLIATATMAAASNRSSTNVPAVGYSCNLINASAASSRS